MANLKQSAVAKLEKELAAVEKKKGHMTYATIIVNYLIKRCNEDIGLSEDVMQEHKTWDKCWKYVQSEARKLATGNCACVEDSTVFEWAEDYYHKDDKAEEAKNQQKEKQTKPVDVGKKSDEITEVAKEQVKPAIRKTAKAKKESVGQVSLFDLM